MVEVPSSKTSVYTCSGTTTTFAFTFPVTEASQVKVYINGIQQLATAYTVTLVNGGLGGGSATMVTAPVSGARLVVLREVDFKQEVDLVDNEAFFAQVIEGVFDKLTMLCQQLQEQLGRCAMTPVGMDSLSDWYPIVVEAKGYCEGMKDLCLAYKTAAANSATASANSAASSANSANSATASANSATAAAASATDAAKYKADFACQFVKNSGGTITGVDVYDGGNPTGTLAGGTDLGDVDRATLSLPGGTSFSVYLGLSYNSTTASYTQTLSTSSSVGSARIKLADVNLTVPGITQRWLTGTVHWGWNYLV